MKTLRRYRTSLGGFMTALVAIWQICSPMNLRADTLYKTDSGGNTTLDTAIFTPTAPGSLIQNYAEGTAFTAADLIAFNNLITAATTFRISNTTATNLQVGGLTIGSLFNGAVINPSGTITIQNGAGASGAPVANTLTLGASGIDLSLATQNLTISQDTTNGSSLSVTTSANQIWTNRTGRTISLAAAPLVLAHNVTLQGAGTTTFGASGTGAISGAGNLIIDGAQSGANMVVNFGGTNTGWTGAVQVGSTSLLRGGVTLNLDQSAAGQNKLADGQVLTINHATVNLQGTGGGTETVGSVALGQGLNTITRSAGTGVLQMNAITRATGAAINFGATSIATTDTLNTANGILGAWAVVNNSDWAVSSAATPDTAITALAAYTTQNTINSWAAGQNILVNGAPTAGTASNTISTLKIAHTTATTAVTIDMGALGNTLTLNDGGNGGGILRNQNATTQIGNNTIGQNSLTAGGVDDSVNDTLYLWNNSNTMSVNSIIKNNNTGVGTDTLHLFVGGAGTVTLMANNTYTGGTTNSGSLNLGNNSAAGDFASLGTGDLANFGTLSISPQAATSKTIANNITGTGALTVFRGNVTFSGNNNYSGITTIGNDTAQVTVLAGSTNGFSSNSRFVFSNVNNTATLDLNGFDNSVAALSGTQNAAVVALGGKTLTLSGSDLANSGSSEVLSLTTQSYQGGFTGAGNLIKNGLYTQVFNGSGTLAYSGTTTVNAGVLQTNKAMATSALTINNSSVIAPATFISNIANSLTGTTAVNLANAGSTWQINNGFNQSIGSLAGVTDSRVFLQGGAGNIVLTINDNGGVPTVFNGVINAVSGAGVGSVVKAGTNTWVLGGGNSFAGGLTINGGIVQVAASNPVGVLGDLVPVTLADAVGVALDINGNNGSIGSLAGGGTTGGNVTLGATGTLTTGYNNGTTSFGGVISGGTAGINTLVKLGTGTQTLSGANTFLGNVLINNRGGQSGGGLTIGAGGSLADTVAVRNAGYNTTFSVNNSDVMGAVTGTANTSLSLGSGATLTSTYANGTPTVLAGTADSAVANGRIVRNINTAGLKAGDLISGTGITSPGYIVQIIDADTVLINRIPPGTSPAQNLDFAPTVTSVNVLHSALTGLGGFTKDGTGLLILTGNSTHSGATTINAGDVQVGGIWTGQKFSIHDALSDNSSLVFAATGTQNLNFADSTTNLLSFERVGSLAGGSVNSNINLTAGSNIVAFAFGSDNTSTTYSGSFLPGTSAGILIKEGTGTFTWNNPTGNTYDGILQIRGGGFTTANQGLDGAQVVQMINNATTFTSGVTDSITILEGGAGVSRVLPNGTAGGLFGNYLSGSASAVINTGTILTVTSTVNSGFNGAISGAGGLTKAGAAIWQLYGTNTYTGETSVSAGTLTLGALSRSAGVGAISGSDIRGSISDSSTLNVSGGTFNLNGFTEAVNLIRGTGGTFVLGNGSLSTVAQTTQTITSTFTGNRNAVLNLNAVAPATVTLTSGSSGAFAGTVNVGTNAALTLGTGTNFGDLARINLNGTGTQLTLAVSDNIGSVAGTGNIVLTGTLGLLQAESGTVSAPAFSGATSGGGALNLTSFGGLTISGNLAHTGGIGLSNGSSLNLNYGLGNNILPTTGALTLNGGTVRIRSSSTGLLESAASTTLNAGASMINGQSGLAFIGLGAITRSSGGTLNVTDNSAATSTANTGTGILGGYATLNGATWAVANGATTAITGLATYNADTFVAAQHTDITAAGSNVGGSAATLRFSGANATDITGLTTLSLGGILVTRNVDSNTSTISGALDATGNELIIHQYNPLGDLILSNVAGTNTAITTIGGGKTLITNSISGTGVSTVGYGYLQLGDATVGGSTTGMVGSGTIRNDGTLGINRSNAQTLGGIISGAGNIEQLGSGITTLSAANTYLGRTTIRGGTLEITNINGLGGTNFGLPNRWANLTSVNTGGTLRINVAVGGVDAAAQITAGTITEFLNLDGGTLELQNTLGTGPFTATATTLAGPFILRKDTTINVANTGAAVNHLITGEVLAQPGADMTVDGVVNATPSTLVLAPTSTTGARWENTTINTNGRLQIGNNSRGFLGTGTVSVAGTLLLNPNDTHYVVGNTITGAGTIALARSGSNGNTYLTGDLSGFTGTLLISSPTGINNSGLLELANDTYSAALNSSATINITSNGFTGTSGVSSLRTHYNQDIILSNTINMTPATDGTNAKNAQLIRAGLGSMTLNGTINLGATNAAPGTQRNLIQTEAGGKLFLNATLTNNGNANNLLNIVNNNIVVIGGSASQTYNGILSGNSTWIFDNSGTTTLSGANSVNSANNYIRKGTVSLAGGAASNDDNDWHVLRGGSLNIAATETIGSLHMQRGAVTNIASGQTLTIDDAVSQLVAGQFTGAGNLTLGGGNFMAMYSNVANTISGNLQLGVTTTNGTIAATNLTNAIGSFGAITLGVAGNTGIGGIEYTGAGETFANNITVTGTNTTGNYIAANGAGALILSGNITSTSASGILRLIGQTGGYFNPITNRIDGIISDGSNVLSIAMPSNGDDDRFGVTSHWALTNASNDFSGNVTVNVGMLELAGNLKTGVETTSVLGDLSATRVITLGSNNFNGRRYDMFGNTDQLNDAGATQGTNTITPSGDFGTLIFNDTTGAGTVTLGTNISYAMPNVSTANTAGAQFINNGTKNVIMNGAFNMQTTGNRQIVFDGSNTGSNQFNGILANPATSQTTSVIKEGAGTWRLGGANTYTGTTTVNNGILELAGGSAIADANTVALSADGGDGMYSGTAKLRIINSEVFANLTGDIGSEVEILTGQTLTLRNGAANTFNGVISGAGGFTKDINNATSVIVTLANKNTYTGVTTFGPTTGATNNVGLNVYHLGDGGAASGVGASTSAAGNLVFTTVGNNGGVLSWLGFTSQSTDRLFTFGTGTNAARIDASGQLIGTSQALLTWSNTGALAMSGSGTRTLTLEGTGIGDNVFRPQITDGTGGATSLVKTEGGLWLVNPGASGNTYTGGTSITGGTLAIQAGNALGNGLITINGGGGVGLQLRGGITLTNAITNSTAEGGIRTETGANVVSGLVTAAANLRIYNDSTTSLELSNATSSLTGAGILKKYGAGTLILSGVNGAGFTGATEVSGGTLKLEYGTNDNSKLANGASLTLGFTGAGAVTTTGVDDNVAGQTYITGMAGGRIDLSGGTHVEVVSGTNLNNGANSITRSSGSATLQMGALTRAVAPGIAAGDGLTGYGTIDFGTAGIATTSTTNVGGATANAILGGYATVNKTDWALNSTNGVNGAINAIAATAYNNNTGVTTFGSGFNTDVLVNSTLGANTTTQSLRFNQAGAITLDLGNFTLSTETGGILVTPTSGNVIITNGTINRSANTVGLDTIFHVNGSASQTLTIDAVIANNTNAQAITKTGAGTLILTQANSITNRINLQQGTLQVGDGTIASANARIGTGGSTFNQISMAEGTVLRFNVANPAAAAFNTQVISGGGTVELAASNTAAYLFDDNLDSNFYGHFNFYGGTIQLASQNSALGNIRGLLNIANSVNLQFNSGVTLSKVTNYAEGTILNLLNNTTTSTGTFAGVQNFNNTTTGGLDFNIAAPTTAGTVGLNITGTATGTKGFTKTGNGILQLSAVNFSDVYDGYTGINKTATLSGQIAVNQGTLYVGNARALGAHGTGNEVIVASGASVDLRGAALNYGDDSDTTRKIIEISGTGFNGTGALRNTTGTGQVSFLTLNADSLINSGGLVNASALIIGTFDSDVSNANSLSGAFTRNAPVIDGGGFDLTIQGGRNAQDNVIFADPTFSSALDSLIIRGSSVRFRHEITANIGGAAGVGITAADITNGIEIGYGGVTLADLTGATAGNGANTGARLMFENFYGTHHTVNISMNGTLAAANNGANYLQADFFTIPDGTVYLDGGIALSGAASSNVIISDSSGNYSVVEQGNTTIAPVTKLVIGGAITGTGGFTKIGSSETRLTANNTFSGDLNVLRFGSSAGPWESHTYKINGVDYATNGLGEGWAEWGLTLNGANGAISDVGTINLQRRGMITLDNTQRLDATSAVTGGNNNDRIANDSILNMENGWLRLNAGTVANTETLGTVNINSGTNLIDLYGTDGANVNNVLTITTLNRTAGGTLRINNLDATSTFASTAGVGDSTQVAVTTLNAPQIGGLGAANTTTRSIVQGVFSGNIPLGLETDLRILGFNNGNVTDLWNQQRNLQFLAGSHFTTYDGGFLRPLDDDEYFSPTDGIISSATAANQNVNLSDVFTIVKDDATINALRLGALQDHDGSGGTLNASTTLTNMVDHHAIQVMVDGTLKISSGMISSAYFTMGNTASASTVIMGGSLDFDGKEAIINNQNGYYRLTDGTIQTGNFEIRSNITNAAGLTKTGLATVILDGANTYAGLTTINDGALFLRNGRTALGVGGTGNGVVITGNGSLTSGNGIQVGTASAREDIYVGVLQGNNQIMRNDNDVTVWYSNVTLDNVDAAGHAIFTPVIRTDNSATSIIYGNIAGGNTAVLEDISQLDPRRLAFNSAGNNVFIIRGQFGDKLDGSGNAIPVTDPVSTLPSLAGTRTNENQVLRVDLGGASLETNYILDQQYNAAGRLTLESGTLLVNYNPATSPDGTGFWTDTAISKIPNADSTTTTFATNGGTVYQGFQLGASNTQSSVNNGNTALFLTRAGQVFNMASWSTAGTGTKYIGGLNESGAVTFGNGTGTLTIGGALANFLAADGGKVVIAQRLAGAIGTAPTNFNFLKEGRGTVELQNSTAGATSTDSNFILAGGTLLLNHTAATSVALVGVQNARFDGGTLISVASSGANTTENIATDNAANRVLNFSLGGNEIVARTTNTGVARDMMINLGNANANAPSSNFTRSLGATANLVEDNAVGGTAQITLQFNSSTTAAVKNQAIAWATYGTLSRTATDFAMSDSGAGNDVRAFGRAADEYNNNVAAWAAGQDVSENGGAGFSGTLAVPLSVSTVRFDANADSVVNLGTNVLTVAGSGLGSSGGALLVSSNTGAANKTITGSVGAALTTTGGTAELLIHQYGLGNLNVNVPITGAINLTIAGPSTTNASTIGTTGAVVLNGSNTYTGQTFINGAVLSISNVNQLGTNAGASSIVMNGGTLRYTGTGLQSLGTKGIEFQGNGGTLDIADGSGELYLDTAIISNAQFRGDLIKVGAGTLTLNGTAAAFASAGNPGFLGLIDVRQGTLRLAGDHGNNTAGNESSEATAILGTSNGYADGTIFRNGTNLAIQMGNSNDVGGYAIHEWLTFEGNNYVSIGTINTQTANTNDTATSGVLNPVAFNPNNERPVNLNGIITIHGTTTFDIVPGQTARFNNGGVGYLTGNGDIIKDGQGTLEIRANSPDYTGNLTVLQGRLMGLGQADVLGTGNTITLGSDSRQGVAEIAINSESAVQNWTIEINQDINVVYNPSQTKRLTFETMGNGGRNEMNGDITLNDNLNFYINDAAETGGSQNYVNLNGKLKDGAATSGNLVFQSDDTGNANDNTNGRVYNYLVLKNDNSAFTGDVRVSTHTSYDQDETAILRLEHTNALGAANDVDMGFNSMLQIGGGARTIGALSTNGGTGPFIGDTAGGTMGASTNGTSVIIENASTTAGTITITQSTPAAVETQWNAYFRDGKLNSEFFAPGVGPTDSAALNVEKAGNGWATMTLDNAYTGTTTVSAGTLQVGRQGVGDTGAVRGAAVAGLNSAVGTTVAGTGVIQGAAVVLGQLRPGDEAGTAMGTLMINGNATLGATSVTSLQIQRASYTAMNAVGYDDGNYSSWISGLATDPTYGHLMDDPITTSQHDQLRITGGLTLTTGGKVVLENNGYNPTAGDVFNLLDWVGSMTGSFNVGNNIRSGAETGLDLDLFELGSGFSWDVSQFNTSGVVVVVVPEPSRVLLLMFGLMALFFRRRRRSGY